MTPESWRRVREILEQALEVAPDRRSVYLEEVCAGNATLRREVEALIAADEQAGTGFLAGSAVENSTELAAPEEPVSLAGARIGPYLVVEEIGHGGMGTVYRAVRADDQYRKQVAIKVVRGGLGDEFRLHRFKAERQILANLDHANIARLLDGGTTEEGLPYVVMEFIEGRPIDEYCDQGKLPVGERLKLFRTVCSAVAYAHQRLVIHRDIKPANILVTKDGEPKLLDFGIAKILDPDEAGVDQTVTVMRLMTPEYASPEQVRGETITTASDVYSLGVVLYGLLTGRRPYGRASRLVRDMVQAVIETEPEKPSASVTRAETVTAQEVSETRDEIPEKLQRRLRGDLDNIVLKALRKEPERRYASVEQFSEDIRRHLEGLPVIARPDTFFYRSSKFVKRHKAGVAAAVIVFVTLVAGLAITAHETFIARTERAKAEARFNDVRKLANSLLFDVHDAIQTLPGATPARKLIVDRALQYLDALAKEAKGDLSLQRELGAAYEKVGDVQGGFRASNLGDVAGSIASYRKSLAIRQAVVTADPDNIAAARELITSHGKLSDALMGVGDSAGSLDQLRQLLPIADKLSAAGPKNLADRRNLALAYLDYGWKRADAANWQNGVEDCRKAAAMLESLAAAEPGNKRTQRVLALAYERIGDILSTFGQQHTDSLTMHQKALAIEESLLAPDPENTALRRLKAWETIDIGDELRAQGDAAGGLDKYREALITLRALSLADPKSVQFHIDVGNVRARVGTALLESGNARAALAELQSSLSEFAASSTDADARPGIGLDEFRIGKAYELLGDRQQAQLWYQKSLPALEDAQKRGLLHRLDADVLDLA
ncbi:MAG TPA: protein kinase, partial [Bryobacteraceae bacterium]|nr:protein kinase [Bryobacteraceae bacterium]